jgi:hypothetical protein
MHMHVTMGYSMTLPKMSSTISLRNHYLRVQDILTYEQYFVPVYRVFLHIYCDHSLKHFLILNQEKLFPYLNPSSWRGGFIKPLVVAPTLEGQN